MRKFWAKIILLNQPADVSFSPSNFNVHGACTEHSWGCSKIKIHKPRLLLTTSYPKLPENPISKIKSLLQTSSFLFRWDNKNTKRRSSQDSCSTHLCSHLWISHTFEHLSYLSLHLDGYVSLFKKYEMRHLLILSLI
jgi:hypothetical protein